MIIIIVWTPKYRFRVLFGEVKSLVENDIRMLFEWKGVEVMELNVQIDHIHVVCSIPPKVSVLELLGTLKGKLAIKIFKSYPKLKQKPYWGNYFWSRGYFVTTVGVDEDIIRRYVKYQEGEDKREERQRGILICSLHRRSLKGGLARCFQPTFLEGGC